VHVFDLLCVQDSGWQVSWSLCWLTTCMFSIYYAKLQIPLYEGSNNTRNLLCLSMKKTCIARINGMRLSAGKPTVFRLVTHIIAHIRQYTPSYCTTYGDFIVQLSSSAVKAPRVSQVNANPPQYMDVLDRGTPDWKSIISNKLISLGTCSLQDNQQRMKPTKSHPTAN
jgi:hypothetical protein